MTKKLIASLGALFLLYCSIDTVAADVVINQEPPSASETFGVVEAEQAEPTPMDFGDMSPEEKERRREVCNKYYEACRDRCTARHDFGKERTKCYNECMDSMKECMKDIPN